MLENKKPFVIGDLIYPLVCYYLCLLLVQAAAEYFIGSDTKHYMLCHIIATIVTIPVIYLGFYKKNRYSLNENYNNKSKFDRKLNYKNSIYEERYGEGNTDTLSMVRALIQNEARFRIFFIFVAIVLSLFVGKIFTIVLYSSSLTETSSAFNEANANFFGSTLLLEIIGSVILTPILEEMLYRGIILRNLSRSFSWPLAIFLSAFLFGLMHFNIVQFIYAFVLGTLFGLYLCVYDNLMVVIICHMAVNLMGVLVQEIR